MRPSPETVAVTCFVAALLMFVALVVANLLWLRKWRQEQAKNEVLGGIFRQVVAIAGGVHARMAEVAGYAEIISHLPARMFTHPRMDEED